MARFGHGSNILGSLNKAEKELFPNKEVFETSTLNKKADEGIENLIHTSVDEAKAEQLLEEKKTRPNFVDFETQELAEPDREPAVTQPEQQKYLNSLSDEEKAERAENRKAAKMRTDILALDINRIMINENPAYADVKEKLQAFKDIDNISKTTDDDPITAQLTNEERKEAKDEIIKSVTSTLRSNRFVEERHNLTIAISNDLLERGIEVGAQSELIILDSQRESFDQGIPELTPKQREYTLDFLYVPKKKIVENTPPESNLTFPLEVSISSDFTDRHTFEEGDLVKEGNGTFQKGLIETTNQQQVDLFQEYINEKAYREHISTTLSIEDTPFETPDGLSKVPKPSPSELIETSEEDKTLAQELYEKHKRTDYNRDEERNAKITQGNKQLKYSLLNDADFRKDFTENKEHFREDILKVFYQELPLPFTERQELKRATAENKDKEEGRGIS